MLLIESKTTNPYFNIATEEYLLKNREENILFLYKNAPSVIIGKHQIHHLEVNIPHIVEKNIPVIRRISGGGSVYHDEQNLNYSIITSENKAWVNFDEFTKPFIHFLKSLDLHPELRSKSDVRLAGKKISGNASHIFKSRVMHHGSILFATALDELTSCLKNRPTCYKKKVVNSRRSIVTNIKTHLNSAISFSDFTQKFIEYLYEFGSINSSEELSDEATCAIQNLALEKYSSVEWNVGYNANYTFTNSFLHNGKIVNITLEIKKGVCETAKTNHTLCKDIERVIQNVPHETFSFTKALSPYFSSREILSFFF
ncbi:lipoate-protein ligase A [Balneicella halophila]|uniref:Lipoate-protein ligase A n=1 Tax=Balneicella halophila TaxID=1537566 RepID=A0A7L4UQS5_BALHA|nr:biotin/lipoate A/B protein ligase family protein [Balneicella halophila]PVX52103.1 lipoate-protein ligase A [Balneicella halophila]